MKYKLTIFLCVLIFSMIITTFTAKSDARFNTTVFCIVNGPIALLNLSKLTMGESGKIISLVGLATGTFQTVYGSFVKNEYCVIQSQPCDKDKLKALARMNIGLGLGTILISTLNIVLNIHPVHKVSLQSFQMNGEVACGISYKKTF